MYQITINLYNIIELPPNSMKRAIKEHRGEVYEHEGCVFDSDEQALENIELNGYLFFYDGELADVTEFTDGHNRANQLICSFAGQEYQLRG